MARKDTDLHRILETEQAILRRLSEIEKHLNPHHIHRFTITQSGDNTMPLTPLAPGQSPVFTATPVPSTAVPSTPPTWTSSISSLLAIVNRSRQSMRSVTSTLWR